MPASRSDTETRLATQRALMARLQSLVTEAASLTELLELESQIADTQYTIDRLGPVVYSGYGKEGGHAFVVDGYDEQDYLHVNWGWSGQDNGFFAVPGEFDKYTEGHTAVLGLKKNAGGKAPEDLRMARSCLKSSTTSYALNQPFTVSGTFFNYSAAAFNGDVAIAKFDRTDKLTEVVCDPVTLKDLASGYGYDSIPSSAPSPPGSRRETT